MSTTTKDDTELVDDHPVVTPAPRSDTEQSGSLAGASRLEIFNDKEDDLSSGDNNEITLKQLTSLEKKVERYRKNYIRKIEREESQAGPSGLQERVQERDKIILSSSASSSDSEGATVAKYKNKGKKNKEKIAKERKDKEDKLKSKDRKNEKLKIVKDLKKQLKKLTVKKNKYLSETESDSSPSETETSSDTSSGSSDDELENKNKEKRNKRTKSNFELHGGLMKRYQYLKDKQTKRKFLLKNG